MQPQFHLRDASQLRIAVVGSGISGLAAAFLLGEKHKVSLFEKNAYLGGHTNTIEVDDEGSALSVDTGFIVYNELNYPHLTGLFRILDIETQDTDMSFSVSMDEGRLEYGGANLSTLFAQRRNLFRLRFLGMVRDILRFNRLAKSLLADPNAQSTEETLGEFLQRHHFGQALCREYLLPMAGAIWSCPTETMLRFPMLSFARFFNNHGLLNIHDRPQWKTVVGGSWMYVKRLVASGRFTHHTGTKITRVLRTEQGVHLPEVDAHFDAIVFASHADETLAMLDNPDERERAILGAFSFQENHAYLHTDRRLMPRRQKIWSSWNYYGRQEQDGHQAVAVTYWMNRLQKLSSSRDWLVTLNPPTPPASEMTHARITYHHPVFDAAAIHAQGRIDEIQGHRRSWYCGAWQGYGFHEDGLRSAVNVAGLFGIKPPWEPTQP